MSSAKNHARRSRRGYRLQKSITGGYGQKTWVKLAEKRKQADKVSLFRRIWWALSGRNPAGMGRSEHRD